MIIEPAGSPRLRFEVGAHPGDPFLVAVTMLATGEVLAGDTPEAGALWNAQAARNAIAGRAMLTLDTLGIEGLVRFDLDGVVMLTLPGALRPEHGAAVEQALTAELGEEIAAGALVADWTDDG